MSAEKVWLQYGLYVGTRVLDIVLCIAFIAVAIVLINKAYIYKKDEMSVKEMVMLIIPSLVGVTGLIIGVCVLRVVPGIWLQGGLGAALIVYVAWQLLHRAGTAHPESMRGCAVSGFASGFANAAISFSGPPVAIYALYVGWDKDTTRGTLSLYFLGISICTCIVQAAAGLYTPVVVKAALWGMPGALVGLVVSLPVARFVRESVFQGILLVMIAFAGSVCIIRAVESLL